VGSAGSGILLFFKKNNNNNKTFYAQKNLMNYLIKSKWGGESAGSLAFSNQTSKY
jgi:hypothetical protein